MTEIEYITATNLAKVRIASEALRDALTGFDGVLTTENLTPITRALARLLPLPNQPHRERKPSRTQTRSGNNGS